MRYIWLLIPLMLSGCLSAVNPFSCQPGDTVRGRPCWVVEPPDRGLVVSSPFYIRRHETRQHLFDQALAELSRVVNGGSVTTNTIVRKDTKVINSSVSSRGQVVTLATVNTPQGAVDIKAKILDEWSDTMGQVMYLWVEEE